MPHLQLVLQKNWAGQIRLVLDVVHDEDGEAAALERFSFLLLKDAVRRQRIYDK